jgi:RNA polymerase sigma-70 factor (ECF subfamily)
MPGTFQRVPRDMAALSTEELVHHCQHAAPGDTRAFEQIVVRYKDRVFATAYRYMGNRQEAEDQAQEIFLKVYRKIRSLDEPATLSSWIYRIATNTCIDALNQRRRRPATTPLDPPEADTAAPEWLIDEHAVSPEEQALRNELRRCLEQALQNLAVDERSVLLMRDLDGRAYQEIAELLKIGLSAVKMRIHRARLAFQRLFERICPEAWRRTSHNKSNS